MPYDPLAAAESALNRAVAMIQEDRLDMAMRLCRDAIDHIATATNERGGKEYKCRLCNEPIYHDGRHWQRVDGKQNRHNHAPA